jgi:glycosyltransferase involved in cell wall biosynthesis
MRALLVSYAFPPVGGAGVGRVLKLSKYLPEFGVEASVLTVANPSVPVTDPSLERDVRPEMEVLRARTLEPGYQAKKAAWSSSAGGGRSGAGTRILGAAAGLARQALIPDPQILWQPGAQRALARRLWSDGADDVVFISGPPFSQFLLAPLARLKPGTAVVLDYRDEWSTCRTTYEMMGGLGAMIGAPLERALLRCAHAVTAATPGFRDNLLASVPFLDPDRVHILPNGYDPDDFPAELPGPPDDRFVVTYAGTIFALTECRGLLEAVRRLHRDSPELARLLRLRFIGRIVDTELEAFEGTEALGVERVGYVPKEQVIPELAASHLALCLLAEAPGTERIYPGKVFELMYLGRPVLTISPDGVLADLTRSHRLGPVLSPRDPAAIAGFLAEALHRFRAGDYDIRARPVGIERFHRRSQAGELARIFQQAIAVARGQDPWTKNEPASAASISSRPDSAASTW